MSKTKDESKSCISKINKKVILKGPILTNSGYGVHTRQIFEYLFRRNDIDLYVQPTLWGKTSWILDDKNETIKNIIKYCQKKLGKEKADVSYQVLLPNEWKNIALKNIGITAGFEADIVKKTWIEYCNNMDLVIVPSIFSRDAFYKTSRINNLNLETKIEVLNEWYYKDFDKCKENFKFLKDLKYDKNILIIGQITSDNQKSDRKNIIKTIKTALDFVKDKNIGIVLKVNTGKFTNNAFNYLKDELTSILENKSLEKICLIFGSLSITELKGLYSCKKITCMLSGTRAEGWGLPFIEAASCGLPIIATNYSAYKEFLDNDFLQIEYEKEIFTQDTNFVDKDSNPYWANFKTESMINNLKVFFENINFYKSIAHKRQIIIKQNYNIDIILNNYKEVFESNF